MRGQSRVLFLSQRRARKGREDQGAQSGSGPSEAAA